MERDFNTPGYRPCLRFCERLTPNLPLIVGDWAHNARSSLDHLAYELVRASGGTPVPGSGGTHFPILPNAPKGPLYIAGGVDAGALALIKAYQPHHRADPMSDPLWLLNEVNNIDKHRTHVIHRRFVGDIRGVISDAAGTLVDLEISGDLEEGAYVGSSTYWTTDTGQVPQVNVDAKGTVGVLLEITAGSTPRQLDLLPLCQRITAYLKVDVLPSFKSFFV